MKTNELVSYPTGAPKGLIKVEVFEGNEKIKEINTNNFISKGTRDYLFKTAIKSLFTQNKAAGGRKIYDELGDPFRVIELTDAAHPEEPEEEWLMKGNSLGYAYSNASYSGSDRLRGTYNAVESYTTSNKVHMVFDFPTHAGNGTISSIYFRDENNLPIQSLAPAPFLAG